MASSFLPFIKESSSEEAIFKSIIQRTKDSGVGVIANLFSIVLELGIAEARKKFDSYSKNLTTSAKVQELISSHPQMHMNKKALEYWSYVMNMERTNNNAHPVFNNKELEIFFAVVAVKRPESLEAAGFKVNTSDYSAYAESDFDVSQFHFKNVSLTEKSSERIGFTCWEEFKVYMAYMDSGEVPISFLPVFIRAENPSAYDYAAKQCRSPYNWT